MKLNLIPVIALMAAVPCGGQSRHRQDDLEVNAVRLWSLTGIARVAIQVSGEFDYHAERAHNPERVFFDIFQARPNFSGRPLFRRETDDPIVRRIRVAETQPGVTRIVLELDGQVEYTASQLANPDRLMVEVRVVSQPAPVTPAPLASPPAPPLVASPPPDLLAPSATSAKPSPPKTIAAKPEPMPADPVAGLKQLETPSEAARVREIGKAAKFPADGTNSLTRVLGLKIHRVVIDPGHGGHDEGTRGPRGLLEKDLVLDVSQRLGKLIEQRLGAEVIYTRTGDTFIPLQQRTTLANDRKADLFLSIHANSSHYSRITGVESYYLNFAASQDSDSMEVAARENATSGNSVFELGDLVQKIAKHEKVEESRQFASSIQTALQGFESRSFPQSKQRGVKRAPFVVLIGAQMPSVLTEIGFLTNSREEALLKKPDYRQRLAEALFRGISRYAQNLSHFQVASAGAD